MRKLVLILLVVFAVVSFIRAFDNSAGAYSENFQTAGNNYGLQSGH